MLAYQNGILVFEDTDVQLLGQFEGEAEIAEGKSEQNLKVMNF